MLNYLPNLHAPISFADDDEDDDIRSLLEGAINEPDNADDSTGSDPAPTEEKTETEPVEEPAAAEADDKTEPEPKEPEEETPTAEEPAKSDQPVNTPAPPPGWPVAAKSKFDDLPDEVKGAIAQREVEINQGFAKLQDYKGLDPYVDMARQSGRELPEVVQAYINAEQMLERDFVGGIKGLCQHYGIQPAQLAQELGGTPIDPNDPAAQAAWQQQQMLDPVVQRLNSIEGSLQSQQQQQQQQEYARAQAEIDAFMNDPVNKYAQNVQNEMALLLQNGQAKSLKDAYDMALRLNPETWQLVINEQVNTQSRAEAEQAQAQANQAKAAAKSVSGAPAGQVAIEDAPADSLRGELERQMASQRA